MLLALLSLRLHSPLFQVRFFGSFENAINNTIVKLKNIGMFKLRAENNLIIHKKTSPRCRYYWRW